MTREEGAARCADVEKALHELGACVDTVRWTGTEALVGLLHFGCHGRAYNCNPPLMVWATKLPTGKWLVTCPLWKGCMAKPTFSCESEFLANALGELFSALAGALTDMQAFVAQVKRAA